MIKITKTDRNYVTISGKLNPAIVDKKNNRILVFFDEKIILELDMEGRCFRRENLNQNLVAYMKWNTEICWQPSHYVNNKRSCDGCRERAYCQCSLNTEKFNFGGKKEDVATETERTGTELSNDCHENDAHESEKSEGIQEQPIESRVA